MNRLIIIGNGFDLAHGIKTSFNDFITEYFCEAINAFYNYVEYEDPLLKINFVDPNKHLDGKPNPVNKETVYIDIEKIKNSKYINFEFKSLLLQNVYNKTSQLQWVDVEMEFFNVLVDTKNNKKLKGVKKLNNELEYLKKDSLNI